LATDLHSQRKCPLTRMSLTPCPIGRRAAWHRPKSVHSARRSARSSRPSGIRCPTRHWTIECHTDLRESANRVASYRPLSSPNFSTRGCTVVANLHTKGEQQGAAAPTPPTILDRRHRAAVALRLRVRKSLHAQGEWYR